LQESGAEEAREHAHGQEESAPAGHPTLSIEGQSTAGDHAVQMRMMHQLLSPGVQDGKESDLGSQVLGIGSDGAQSLSGGGEE
jgi:hypothetical protein